jgi:hypothetical protein
MILRSVKESDMMEERDRDSEQQNNQNARSNSSGLLISHFPLRSIGYLINRSSVQDQSMQASLCHSELSSR